MWALKPVSCPLLFPGCYRFFLLHIYTSFFPTTKHHYIFPFSNAGKTFLCWQNYEVIYSAKSWVVKSARKTNSNSQQQTLIEILWSNLTLEQNSSWIWLSAGTPMLVLSRPEYSELALQPAEGQIQELFCSIVKFDHKISISEDMMNWNQLLGTP